MAIIKTEFNESSTSVDALVSFLQANKTGTFMENLNFSKASTNSGWTLWLSENGTESVASPRVDIGIRTNGTGYSGVTSRYFKYTASSTYTSWESPDSSTSKRYIKDILLCNNGFILRHTVYNNNVSTSDYNKNLIIVTVDSEGHLILIAGPGMTDNSSNQLCSSYYIMSRYTTTPTTIMNNVRYGTNRTCLAPVAVPLSSKPDLYLPYVWVASQSQLAGTGMTAVRINGVDYITNGFMYIRDTPLE